MSLTINQEKQIRAAKKNNPLIVATVKDGAIINVKLALYEDLARHVANYRRAQKLNGPGAADLRRDLINEIDRCLEDLGM